jgi:7,8-dihydropterin-6-yl-methyl-4-(beta-D-ribofuranosyl)aminobenzene 5'-phosphate synthase
MSIKISILVDNNAGEGLGQEHGFSAWIETSNSKILFDTGQGPTLAANALKLGVSLNQAEHLVLSHGHYDHGGGIPHVLNQAGSARIHLHPEALISRYSVYKKGQSRAIGLPRDIIQFLADLPENRINWVNGPEIIAPGVGLTGPIPRKNYYEDTGGPFYIDPQGKTKDNLPDDQALWIDTSMGLIVCAGCAHSGIINSLQHIQSITENAKIRAVIGGFHLLHADNTRLTETMNELEKLSLDIIAPCHCTGDKAASLIRQRFQKSFVSCAAGKVFNFA